MAEQTKTRRGPLAWVKRHKKLTIFLVIVLVIALVITNVVRKANKAASGTTYQYVRTTVLQKTTLSDSVNVNGTVKSGSSASVTASGQLVPGWCARQIATITAAKVQQIVSARTRGVCFFGNILFCRLLHIRLFFRFGR